MFRPETDWLARWAHYTPARRVLRDHGRSIEWTYRDADLRATELAHFLRVQHGIQHGDRVATISRNRSELFFLFFACVKLGAVLVPLNFRLTQTELGPLIADADPSLLFVEGRRDDVRERANVMSLPIEASEANVTSLPIETVTGFLTHPIGSQVAARPSARDEEGNAAVDEDDLVMILYTSGTTGIPKGAMITHRMLFWNSLNTGLRLDLNSGDHTQSYAPLFHTGGWNVLFTPFLHHGGSHTVLEGFDPDLLLRLIEEERSTLLFGVPTMLKMMTECESFGRTDLSSLRYAIVGGAPMPLDLIDIWHDRGVPIRQGYGLTEVGPNCFSLHEDDAKRKAGSIGFPNFYIDATVVTEDGTEQSDDEPGELWLRSPVVTPGYWKKPEETAAACSDGWFHTGDIVRRDPDGFFYVVDRKKNMFISGGENVYPAEVERALVTHPAVTEAAVIGVPDDRWGEVGLAYIVAENERPEEEDLRRHCGELLARYKIPKSFRFLDSLPRNDAGKVDRMSLMLEVNNQEDEP
ncbi:MAG: long-chain fatty acid--CoA ligase [Candidatus Eisenbacteria bacterium]